MWSREEEQGTGLSAAQRAHATDESNRSERWLLAGCCCCAVGVPRCVMCQINIDRSRVIPCVGSARTPLIHTLLHTAFEKRILIKIM